MPKRIRVEFEFDPETVKELLEFAGKTQISEEELERMGEQGVIRASDYMAAEESRVIGKLISKVAGKVVAKAKSDRVKDKASDIVTYTTIDQIISAEAPDTDINPKS